MGFENPENNNIPDAEKVDMKSSPVSSEEMKKALEALDYGSSDKAGETSGEPMSPETFSRPEIKNQDDVNSDAAQRMVQRSLQKHEEQLNKSIDEFESKHSGLMKKLRNTLDRLLELRSNEIIERTPGLVNEINKDIASGQMLMDNHTMMMKQYSQEDEKTKRNRELIFFREDSLKTLTNVGKILDDFAEKLEKLTAK